MTRHEFSPKFDPPRVDPPGVEACEQDELEGHEPARPTGQRLSTLASLLTLAPMAPLSVQIRALSVRLGKNILARDFKTLLGDPTSASKLDSGS